MNNEVDIFRIVSSDAIVIFDHDLGGGTTSYRKRLIDKYKRQNIPILLVLSKDNQKLKAIEMTYFYDSKYLQSDFMEYQDVFELLNGIKPKSIFINSIVTFRPFLSFVKALYVFLQRHPAANIKVAIHDYYPICPSFNLLNYEWRFCGVPTEDECVKCRIRHRSGSLKEPNIGDWQQTWDKIFKLSSAIIIFSESSRHIFLKAFPSYADKLSLHPHSMTYFKPSKTFIKSKRLMHIGILGNISRSKGAEVVQSLSDYIQKSQLGVSISIFGDCELENINHHVNILGKYQVHDLPILLEEYKISVFLMPSICPETFSYVTHELILMEYPIVAFNLGAQGEVVNSYSRGKTVELEIDIEELFNTLASLSSSQNSDY